MPNASSNRVLSHGVTSPGVSMQRSLGNQGVIDNVQPKLKIGEPNDRYEREADALADKVIAMSLPADTGQQSQQVSAHRGRTLQRKCSGCEKEEPIRRKANSSRNASTPSQPAVAGLPQGGRQLSGAERGFFEPRFGHDFSAVRVHSGNQAARAAQSINARAFTLGQNIVFDQGQYNQSRGGRRLMAHELAHTLQQSTQSATPDIFREPNDEGDDLEGLQLPPVTVPGTGLSFIPGPLSPFLGHPRFLLPSRLRIENRSLRGSSSMFNVSLGPQQMIGALLGNLDLYSWTRPGTPTDLAIDPATQARISLVNPVVSYNPSLGVLRGSAILSVGSGYPEILKAPTELNVSFESNELGHFSGRIGFGPLVSDFNLRLHYATERLEQAVSPAFAPQGGFSGFMANLRTILRASVPGIRLGRFSESIQTFWRSLVGGNIDGAQFASRILDLLAGSIPASADVDALRTALANLANEITHPGFSLSGSLGLFGIPITGFSAEAPTTVPLERSLLGAPAPFPLSFSAGGIILAPPGSITDVAVPALGASYTSFDESSGTSATIAALPSISTDAISLGDPFVNQFPVYAYAEVSHVRRINDGLDLGVRVTVQVSTPELFSPAQQEFNFDDALTRTIQDYQSAQTGTSALTTPNIGATLFGRFDLF